MSSTLQLILITTSTIVKIMLCSAVGIYLCRIFTYPDTSPKGLTYVSVHIFLPCLLFSNLCLSVTWDAIKKFYWAPIIALLPVVLGTIACLTVFRALLAPRYRAMLLLGCLFQNGLTFPLSVILNLKGVSWLDARAVDKASSYIFLYNIVCSIGLWGVGEPVIALAKEGEVKALKEAEKLQQQKEEEEEEQQQQQLQDAEMQERERRRPRLEDGSGGTKGGSATSGGAMGNGSFTFPYAPPSRKMRVIRSPAAARVATFSHDQLTDLPSQALSSALSSDSPTASAAPPPLQQREEREAAAASETTAAAAAAAVAAASNDVEEELLLVRVSSSDDDDQGGDGNNEKGAGGKSRGKKRLATAQEQRSWYRPAAADDQPLRLLRGYGADTTEHKTKRQRAGSAANADRRRMGGEEEDNNEGKDDDQDAEAALAAAAAAAARAEKFRVGNLDLDGHGTFSLSERDLGIASERTPEETSSQRLKRCAKRAFTSPPVFVSLLAMVISLLPPLRWVAESFVGQVLVGGLAIIGTGAIPLQLLVLGCTVAATNEGASKPAAPQSTNNTNNSSNNGNTVTVATGESKPTTTTTASRDARGAVSSQKSTPVEFHERISALVSPTTMFIASTVCLRLVIMPGLCMFCIHLLRTGGLIPDERPFLLAMLIGTCAPSAINGSLICAMHDYHSSEYSKMIFVMYLACVPSTAFWLFVYITYLGGH